MMGDNMMEYSGEERHTHPHLSSRPRYRHPRKTCGDAVTSQGCVCACQGDRLHLIPWSGEWCSCQTRRSLLLLVTGDIITIISGSIIHPRYNHYKYHETNLRFRTNIEHSEPHIECEL